VDFTVLPVTEIVETPIKGLMMFRTTPHRDEHGYLARTLDRTCPARLTPNSCGLGHRLHFARHGIEHHPAAAAAVGAHHHDQRVFRVGLWIARCQKEI
jgi:hypothetical protein